MTGMEGKGIIPAKTVLVTGASRGIGRAIALRFAKGGYNVAAGYFRSGAAAQSLKDEINGAEGVCEIYRADVSDFAKASRMVAAAEKRFGHIDVLVNNAGVSESRLFTDLTSDDWQNMMGVNLNGVFNCTFPAVKSMVSRKKGCIINISSVWGITGASCEAAYSASKAAVIGLTKALAKELGPSNIRVNCVAPGVIATDMLDGLNAGDVEELRRRTPLERIGRAEDIASAVYYLAGEGAEFITGQVVRVDGGFES